MRGSAAAPALLPARTPPSWGMDVGAPTPAVLEALLARWRAYEAGEVDMTVTPHDDMLVDTPEGRAHYRAVGLSALRLATEAMLLTGLSAPRTILDLPCGGGRVTRHLVRFFPEAEVVVADLDAPKVAAVTAQFGVRAVEGSRDFTGPIPGRYDLIFVGSLVTHFDGPLFARAVHRFVDALAPGGVLILTTVGRPWAAEIVRQEAEKGLGAHRWWSPALRLLSGGRLRASRRLAAVERDYARTGFAYVEVRGWTALYGQSYGGSFAAPSWLMRLVEGRPDATVLGFKERGFSDLLDALLIQRVGD